MIREIEGVGDLYRLRLVPAVFARAVAATLRCGEDAASHQVAAAVMLGDGNASRACDQQENDDNMSGLFQHLLIGILTVRHLFYKKLASGLQN